MKPIEHWMHKMGLRSLSQMGSFWLRGSQSQLLSTAKTNNFNFCIVFRFILNYEMNAGRPDEEIIMQRENPLTAATTKKKRKSICCTERNKYKPELVRQWTAQSYVKGHLLILLIQYLIRFDNSHNSTVAALPEFRSQSIFAYLRFVLPNCLRALFVCENEKKLLSLSISFLFTTNDVQPIELPNLNLSRTHFLRRCD